MIKLKKALLIILLLFITVFTMFVPDTVNYVSDYYLGKSETVYRPEISKINITEKEKKKSDIATSLLNSNITEINNIQINVSNKDVINDILGIFSEIFGKEDAYKLFEDMIYKSTIIYIEPRLAVRIEKGETVMLDIIYVKLDCGLDITYEKESKIVLNFNLFNNYTYPEFQKMKYFLEYSDADVSNYYENSIETKNYYKHIEKFKDNDESFVINFGLDFSPDKNKYSEIIYKKDTNV